MKIIDFEQTSESWLEWRQNGIGASDVGVIMGVDPYKSPKRLWKEKCGYGSPIRSNFAMEHGRKNESVAREKFNKHLGLDTIPVCIEDDREGYSFCRASLDGWDSRAEVLIEVKCPVSAQKIHDLKESEKLPDHWHYQMQWQIGIARPSEEWGFFVLYDARDGELIWWKVPFEEEIFLQLQKEATKFWESIRKGICPK